MKPQLCFFLKKPSLVFYLIPLIYSVYLGFLVISGTEYSGISAVEYSAGAGVTCSDVSGGTESEIN